MILASLYDVQQAMLRACVQNVMLFATLPFYLAPQRRPTTERSRRVGSNQLYAARHQVAAGGPERHHRTEDIRWLR